MHEKATETQLRIGARNPFVFAEHKLNEKIMWKKMSSGQKRKKLEEAFGMPYDQLFDPKNNSPLFVKTGDMRPCNTVSNPLWAPNPEGSSYFITSRAFNDPVQGDLPDCYFTAALSSMAFLNMIPDNKPLPSPPELPNTYLFNFFSSAGGSAQPVKITYNLPLDRATNKYRYSKSFTAGEIWVALYEKAFASWVGARTDTPDYSKICTGDPVTALLNLTGKNTSRYSTTAYTGTQIFDIIKSKCNPATKKVLSPMVAYTYDPRIPPIPPGITYTDGTIVGNHSYSVLGFYGDSYIVMRNPWGQKGAGQGSGTVLGDPVGLPTGTLASGIWNNINLADANDAIFGLKSDVFRNYFKGFGWVSL
jgi:hypothetical protein